jgi:hypothetical protein
MQVKIIRETATVNHGPLSRGQVFTSNDIDEKTMQRWVKRNIAVEVKNAPKPTEKPTEYVSSKQTGKAWDITEEDVETTELDDIVVIEEMSFQELRRYAKDHGYENYGKMNREELIEMLTEDEEVEETSPFFDGAE